MQPDHAHASNSDSEDDPDYVPPANEPDSDGEGTRAAKRVKTESAPQEGAAQEEDDAAKESTRQALWAAFQASLGAPPPPADAAAAAAKTVKIEKRHRFAGEDVVEVVEVPEGSDDARKWPLWTPPADASASAPGAPAEPTESTSISTSVPPVASTSASAASKPAKRPGPRKPKTALAPLPGATKAKKLTTLDKSALDWRAHAAGAPEEVKDELDAHRRAGGYLEKVEFLQRVEQRKEDALEASKAGKRRRG